MNRRNNLVALGFVIGVMVLIFIAKATLGAIVRPDETSVAGPTQPNYADAASFLLTDDDHYREVNAARPSVLGTPTSIAWCQRTSTDIQWHDDLAKAEAYFSLENEPAELIDAWRGDNGNAVTDLYELAEAELTVGQGPATANMREWEVRFQADIEKADTDARQLQAMH